MERRLHAFDVVYIDAIDAIDDKTSIDEYRRDYPPQEYPIKDSEIACFLSHLKALRALVESGCDSGLIIEDDVALHIDFRSRWSEIKSCLPPTNLVMLSAYVSGLTDVKDFGLYKTIGPRIYGTQCYWITRRYAREVLAQYDLPKMTDIVCSDPRITAEHITRFSGGVYLTTPLAIEDADDSFIQDSVSVERHRNYYGQWPREQYQP